MKAREPGLLSREVVNITDGYVTLREVWNLKAEGCPMVCLDKNVVSYVREIHLRPEEYEAFTASQQQERG